MLELQRYSGITGYFEKKTWENNGTVEMGLVTYIPCNVIDTITLVSLY